VSSRTIPGPVGGKHVFQQLAEGPRPFCGVDAVGPRRCWRNKQFGQLGVGFQGDNVCLTTQVGSFWIPRMSTTCGWKAAERISAPFLRETFRIPYIRRDAPSTPAYVERPRMSPAPSRHEPAVTQLLNEAASGSSDAYDRLLPLVYHELKGLAVGRLRSEREGHTLNATALVHETYLKLVDQDRVEWNSRAHFYAVASQAMRRTLIDHARTRRRAKRGGAMDPLSLDGPGFEEDPIGQPPVPWDDLIALDSALERLAVENRRSADIVQYRFFGGLTYDEIAEVLGVSVPTVRRGWIFARMWLRRELDDKGS